MPDRVAGPHGRTEGIRSDRGRGAHRPARGHDGDRHRRAGAPGAPRAARAYAVLLFLLAATAGVVLLVAGAGRPAPGPVLVLALVAALCVNRFALFPSEHAATAEAAVLLAAVVGFRTDAAYLGPLVVALLTGPLDAVHWEQRSFLRMAYNAGNRGLAALVAAATLAACTSVVDDSVVAWCVVVLTTATAFVAVDLLASTILLRCFGERSGAALRHLFEVDVLTLPVACYGACAALALEGFGWWAVALALVPVAFVPELVIARARGHAQVVRDVFAVLGIAAVATVATSAASVPGGATRALLVGIAALAGIELATERAALVPPLTALVVVAAVVVAHQDAAAAAALGAVVTVLVSWCRAAQRSRTRLLVATATAAGAALLAAGIVSPIADVDGQLALGALAAGFVVEGVAIAVGAHRRRSATTALWTIPLVAAAVAWASVWRAAGAGGGPAFAAALAVTMAAVVWWASPPWRSGVLTRVLRGRTPRHLAALLVLVSAGAVVAAAVAAVRTDRAGAVTWAWISSGLGESVVAVVALGVRQWRFAPRPRAVALTANVLGALALLLVPSASADGVWWSVPIVAGGLLVVLLCVRTPARLARASLPGRSVGAASR